MPYNTRHHGSNPRGSFTKFFETAEDDFEDEEEEVPTRKPPTSRRASLRSNHRNSSSDSEEIDDHLTSKRSTRQSKPTTRHNNMIHEEEPEDENSESIASSRPKRTPRKTNQYTDFLMDGYESEEKESTPKSTRRKAPARRTTGTKLQIKRELVEAHSNDHHMKTNNVVQQTMETTVITSGAIDDMFKDIIPDKPMTDNVGSSTTTTNISGGAILGEQQINFAPITTTNTNTTTTGGVDNVDTSLNRSQSAISEQSDDHKGKKRKKDEEDEDFVMNDDEQEEEEAIEVSDDALSDIVSSNDELEEISTRRRKRTKFVVDDEEMDEPKENGKDIKKRLRPRTQAQLNPYSHPTDNIEIPSKSTMIKEQQDLLAPLESLTFHFSESDSESDTDDETGVVNPAFGKKGEYDHIKPINVEQLKKKPSADIDPLFSKPVGFDMVGGLHKHINALKEMVVLPLLYPEVFNKFDITPPRGVIFYGPPGTGKTLVARALASTCGTGTGGSRPIAFFMRKGADILSKWVGEAEKQLRLLFDEAKRLQPSIIFFDEIDGLAPVRSSKQDYIHSSIVSTLLALMDGLDSRGQVVVIGATNRIDSIDPALRRPGRFDRELLFTLPAKKARKEILQIHTKNWTPQIPDDLKNYISLKSVGYCGADIKALCAESALNALKRSYPQVYTSQTRLLLELDTVEITKVDFLRAMKSIVPASHRNAVIHASPLPIQLAPCLSQKLEMVLRICKDAFPMCIKTLEDKVENDQQQQDVTIDSSSGPILDDFEGVDEKTFESNSNDFFINPPTFRPWVLIHGSKGMGQNLIASAVLYSLEEFPLFSLRYENLISNTSSRSEIEAIINIIAESRKNSPSILWIPNLDEWFEKSTDLMKSTLISLLNEIPSSVYVFVLATCNYSSEEMPPEFTELFADYRYEVTAPTREERVEMFKPVLGDIVRSPLKKTTVKKVYPTLPLAPPTELKLTDKEANKEKKLQKQERVYLKDLRTALRDIINRIIANKVYSVFVKPSNEEQRRLIPDSSTNEQDGKIYLVDILFKLENKKYNTVKEFAKDFEKIVKNAQSYIKQPAKYLDRLTVKSKANALYDSVRQAMKLQIPEELSNKCKQIAKRRITHPTTIHPTTTQPVVKVDGEGKDQPIIVIDEQHMTDGTTAAVGSSNDQPMEITETATNTSSVEIVVSESSPSCYGVAADTTTTTTNIVTPGVVSPNEHSSSSTSIGDQQQQQTINNSVPAQSSSSSASSSLSPPPPTTIATTTTTTVAIPLQTPIILEEEIEQPEVPVIVDQERMNSWFDNFISFTEGTSLESLDKAFSVIYKSIYRYRFTADRTTLMEELERYGLTISSSSRTFEKK